MGPGQCGPNGCNNQGNMGPGQCGPNGCNNKGNMGPWQCGPNGCNNIGPIGFGGPIGNNPGGWQCGPNGCNLGSVQNMPGFPGNQMGSKRSQSNLNVGNPDIGRIERPCPNLDIDCIRKYFHEHGHCEIVKNGIHEPYHRMNKVIHYLPSINVTLTFPKKAEVRGLSNGFIEEFYINRDTDKAVLAINFRNIQIYSKKSYFRFHRRAKEPVVTEDYTIIDVEGLITTSIIPQIYNLDLEKMVIYPFVDEVKQFAVGPHAFQSDDTQVQLTPLALALNLQSVYSEFFMSETLIYPIVFIQKNICHFDIPFLV
ncbi:uncharacterized protein LOC113228694 isoform X2 [Hyposmocoma kahamanoa]|nr:uncharacterized protein LOC113228694 isoform X2 [Hyposmocoma kahamanoa]